MHEKENEERKTALTVLKDFLDTDDLRSILALIVTIGGLLLIGLRHELTTEIVSVMMLVLTFYFSTKDRDN